MDIVRTPEEMIRIWKGGDGNIVEALSVDPGIGQVVLVVREQRTRYEEKLAKSAFPTLDSVRRHLGARDPGILRETAYNWILERWTPSNARRFLCGWDETHLFVAQVEEGDTVAEAHESLKPEAVRLADGPVHRQGEWFFVPTNEEPPSALVEYDRPIEFTERPHVAEHIYAGARDVYVRGFIRHVDHPTLVLPTWHEVHLNNEVRDEPRRKGIYWID